jgi:hypothetical protein
MHSADAPDTSRRSSRVPIALPVLVTALSPDTHFSEMCETMVVSAHGCALRSPAKLEAGSVVHFHSKEGREATAHVVDCQPMNSGQRHSWRLAARLDQPENFWALQPCPQDWLSPKEPSSWRQFRHKPSPTPGAPVHLPPQVAPAGPEKPLSEDRLNAVLAESLRPLRAELTSLQEALAKRESRRSNFDISLSYIPPEVENKLFSRLHQDLGPQVIHQACSHAEQAIASARAAIDQKVAEGEAGFRRHLEQELQTAAQRSQSLATEATDKLRQHLHAGLGSFEQRVLEAGAGLEGRAEALLDTLQQRLGKEHDAHCIEMKQLQTTITAEAARLQSEVASLDARIGRLDESARRLECDLDARLQQLASDMITRTRAELDATLAATLKEFSVRGARELSAQLDSACGNLKIIQKGIESSASELLRNQVTESLREFEQTLGAEARCSAERWRHVLAGGLSALVNTLGDHFRVDTPPAENA